MFSIDSMNFLRNPLSFGFKYYEADLLVLHVFYFQGPSRCQTDPIFLPHHFFENRRPGEEQVNGNTMRTKRGPTMRDGAHLVPRGSQC
jgi:hypothetical protein